MVMEFEGTVAQGDTGGPIFGKGLWEDSPEDGGDIVAVYSLPSSQPAVVHGGEVLLDLIDKALNL